MKTQDEKRQLVINYLRTLSADRLASMFLYYCGKEEINTIYKEMPSRFKK